MKAVLLFPLLKRSGNMRQKSNVSNNVPVPENEEEFRDRMRVNFWAAIITTALILAGAFLTDELAESYQGGCYRPEGGCEAWGVPTATIGFEEFWQ
jgi:hypothetical protein